MLTTLCLCLAVTSDLPPMLPGMPVPKPKLYSPKASEQQTTPMVRVVPAVVAIPQGFTITNISLAGGQVNLAWQLGTPPFQVYGCPTLNGSWNTVGNSTLARSKAFPAGLNHFWRARDQAKSVLTLNSNSQPRLTWTAPDTDMSDSLGNFTVQKSADQVNWSNITENGGVYPSTARQANDATDPATLPSKRVWYRLLQTTANGVTVPYNVASLGNFPVGGVKWIVQIGGAGTDFVRCIALGPQNTIYAAGVFAGTVDFGYGPAGAYTPGYSRTAAGFGDAFVAKYNSLGIIQWLYVSGVGNGAIQDLAVDASGNCWVSGTLNGGMILKLNSAGALQWVAGPNPATLYVGNQCYFRRIAVDSGGRVVCAGDFVGAFTHGIDFGNGVPIESNSGSTDGFLTKYDTDGTCLFAKRFANSGDSELIRGLVVDPRDDSIIVGGYKPGDIDLSSNDGFITADVMRNPASPPGHNYHCFLGKLKSDGTFDAGAGCWQRMFGTALPTDVSNAGSHFQCMRMDANYDLWIGLYWNIHANFSNNVGDNPGGDLSGPQNFYGTFAIGRYRISDGKFLSIIDPRTGTSGAASFPSDLAIDPAGNIYATGALFSSTTFNGVTLSTTPLPGQPGNPYQDCFVLKYTPAGALVWAQRYGGLAEDQGSSIAATLADVFVGGSFNVNQYAPTSDFGGNVLTSRGAFDGILMSLVP